MSGHTGMIRDPDIRESLQGLARSTGRLLMWAAMIAAVMLLTPAMLESAPDACSALTTKLAQARHVTSWLADPAVRQLPPGIACPLVYWAQETVS